MKEYQVWSYAAYNGVWEVQYFTTLKEAKEYAKSLDDVDEIKIEVYRDKGWNLDRINQEHVKTIVIQG